jgi:hypothetical protein
MRYRDIWNLVLKTFSSLFRTLFCTRHDAYLTRRYYNANLAFSVAYPVFRNKAMVSSHSGKTVTYVQKFQKNRIMALSTASGAVEMPLP